MQQTLSCGCSERTSATIRTARSRISFVYLAIVPILIDQSERNPVRFKTSESDSQGQLLDGDPSYVTNDQALVTNLNLNFKVVVGGSEAALIQSFRTAEANKTPLLAYFYEPQWFFSEEKLVKVDLPAYSSDPSVCPTDLSAIKCDYPPYNLNKLISTKFENSGSPAVSVIKTFHWTNEDQNEVAQAIAKGGQSPDAAAQAWLAAHSTEVNAWLK